MYLSAPVYSQKLAAETVKTLVLPKSEAPPTKQPWRVSAPHTHVKVTAITDRGHAACGQHGLFARQNLEPDSFILPYLGFVHNRSDTNEQSDYDLSLDRELGVGVDAWRMGNEARFINDYRGISTGPNAEFRETFVVGSKTERVMGVFVLGVGKKRPTGIRRGEEILVSYGKGFWAERNSAQDVK